VRADPDQVEAADRERAADHLGELSDVDAEPTHAGVDLEVDRHRAGAGAAGRREIVELARVGDDRGQLARDQLGVAAGLGGPHDEDRQRQPGVAQLDPLLDQADRQRGALPRLLQRARHRHRAVAVGVGLDHAAHGGAAHRAPDQRRVVAERGEIDDRSGRPHVRKTRHRHGRDYAPAARSVSTNRRGPRPGRPRSPRLLD
jgi:hypothetical protein